jgi:glycine betaine/proline transport system permease protein
MTAEASAEHRPAPSRSWLYIWIALIAAIVLLYSLRSAIPWLADYPRRSLIPLADWFSLAINFVKLSLAWLTRAISAAIAVPLDLAFGALSKDVAWAFGDMSVKLPRFSWVGIVALALLAGTDRGGWRLGALAGSCFLYIAVFGQWESAMLTLALIVICVPFGVAADFWLGSGRIARHEPSAISSPRCST